MMLGARTAAWAKSGGGWKNPYITDGLNHLWIYEDYKDGMIQPRLGYSNIICDSGCNLSDRCLELPKGEKIVTGKIDVPDEFTVETATTPIMNGNWGEPQELLMVNDDLGIGVASAIYYSYVYKSSKIDIGNKGPSGILCSCSVVISRTKIVYRLIGSGVVVFEIEKEPYDIRNIHLRNKASVNQPRLDYFCSRIYNRAVGLEELMFNAHADESIFSLP